MKYDIVRIKITPKNIKQFWIKDDRIKHPKFIKDQKHLEKEMVAFQTGYNTNPDYPDRYDLTVFTYNQFEKPWLIVDGSHRIEGLKQIFKRKELKGFDAILLPSNVLGANNAEARVAFSRELDRRLRKEKLPIWIKKYDFAFKNSQSVSEMLLMKNSFAGHKEFISWSNKNRIDTGNSDAPEMPIDEYQKSRKL